MSLLTMNLLSMHLLTMTFFNHLTTVSADHVSAKHKYTDHEFNYCESDDLKSRKLEKNGIFIHRQTVTPKTKTIEQTNTTGILNK